MATSTLVKSLATGRVLPSSGQSYIKLFICSGVGRCISQEVLAAVISFPGLGAASVTRAHRLLLQRLQFTLKLYNVILVDINAQHGQQPVGIVRPLNLMPVFQDISGNEPPLLCCRPQNGSS